MIICYSSHGDKHSPHLRNGITVPREGQVWQGMPRPAPASPAHFPSVGPESIPPPGLGPAFLATGAPSSGHEDNSSSHLSAAQHLAVLATYFQNIPETWLFCHLFPEHSRNRLLFSSPTSFFMVSIPIIYLSKLLSHWHLASAFHGRVSQLRPLDTWGWLILRYGRCLFII